MSRQELVGWLQTQIAEQKRIDATTTGAPNPLSETSPDINATPKDSGFSSEVQLVLPDTKKRGKQIKQIFTEKGRSSTPRALMDLKIVFLAYEKATAIKSALQSNMPVLAVDVTQAHFETMLRSPMWIFEEEAWKLLLTSFPNPPGYPGYHQSIREAVQKRKAEGHAYLLLFAIREDRGQLLALG